MPIRLITGLPGNGKTLLMVSEIVEQAALGERPIYQAGVDGLKAGLAERIDDARDWNRIDPNKVGECTCGNRPPHAHVIPDGSVIYVDEAWKWFGHMHDAGARQVPTAVLELAEHRHRGIDFVWTTQGPNQLYPFARSLIAEHTHIVRRFGTHICKLFTWSELNEEVKSQSKREAAIQRAWTFPKSLFASYKSATQHTIKRKIPMRVFMIPVCIVAALALGLYAYKWLSPSASSERMVKTVPGAGTAPAPGHDSEGSSGPRYATPAAYAAALTPRIASQPWSAPIYDGRKPTTDPQLYCMISGGDVHSTCHCYTEQATPYRGRVDDIECRSMAIWGVYDPFRQPTREARSDRSPVEERSADVQGEKRTPDPAESGGVMKYAQAPHYGQIHTEQAASDTTYHGHL